jgi:hypothetical protein
MDGVSKLGDRLEGDNVCTFFNLDKKTYPTKFNLEIFICTWYNWRGPIMWMSSAVDGNRQKGEMASYRTIFRMS